MSLRALLLLYCILNLITGGLYYIYSEIRSKDEATLLSLQSPHEKITCNFKVFKQTLCLDCRQPFVAKQYLAKCQQIIYNRVPKCASTTMGEILDRHAKINNYTFIWITGYQYVITEDERKLYLKKMTRIGKHHFVLASHHYFFDFNEYTNHSSLYINLVREQANRKMCQRFEMCQVYR